MWYAHWADDRLTVHVLPVNDIFEHDSESDGCLCGPEVELVGDGDGHAWMVTHMSLDGREIVDTFQ